MRRFLVVEAQTIDQRTLLLQTKHTGLGVARLRMGGDGSNFYEAEAKSCPDRYRDAVLVETCSETHWTRNVRPAISTGRAGLCPAQASQQTRGDTRRRSEGVERTLVRDLRVHGEKSASKERPCGIEKAHAGSSDHASARMSRFP